LDFLGYRVRIDLGPEKVNGDLNENKLACQVATPE